MDSSPEATPSKEETERIAAEEKAKEEAEEQRRLIREGAGDGFLYLKYHEHFQRTAPKVYEALQLMAQYSPLGKCLVDKTTGWDVQFLEKEMKSLGRFRSNKSNVQIFTNVKNDIVLNISTLAHELMHAVQGCEQDRLGRWLYWDARGFLLHNRAVEAGAEICAMRICYEMKQNGYPDAFDHCLTKNNKYAILFEVFEHSYMHAIEKGEGQESAMQYACDQAFHTYYKSQPLADGYNAGELKVYIQYYLNRCFATTNFPHLRFGEVETRNLTELSKGEFLISHAKPDVSDFGIFGKNDLMRQAFDYVEALRIRHSFGGKTNFEVQRRFNALAEDENLYFRANVDVAKALEIWEEQETETFTPNMLKIMNELAGLDMMQQLSINFFAASDKNASSNAPSADQIPTPSVQQNVKPTPVAAKM